MLQLKSYFGGNKKGKPKVKRLKDRFINVIKPILSPELCIRADSFWSMLRSRSLEMSASNPVTVEADISKTGQIKPTLHHLIPPQVSEKIFLQPTL